MKRILVILIIAIASVSVIFGQTKMAKDSKAEAEIIAFEKQAWTEWEKGNKKFVENYVADDAFFVYPEGVINKSQIVEAVGGCKFNSYSLDDFKVQMLDKNSALVSYTAKQDIVCGGKPAPELIRASSVYVKKGGKWLNSFYTEVTAEQQESGSAETEIIALEKAGWEAWKNKDAAFFSANSIDEVMWINSEGVSDRAQFTKDLSSCEIKSFSLANFKLVMLDKDAVVLTFTATQDGVCNGQKIPSQVRASSTYVKRGGRWLEAMYMETPMTQ